MLLEHGEHGSLGILIGTFVRCVLVVITLFRFKSTPRSDVS